MSAKKEWRKPQVDEVQVKEDSTSTSCAGKARGCYAGSSCGSVEIKEQPKPQEEPKKE